MRTTPYKFAATVYSVLLAGVLGVSGQVAVNNAVYTVDQAMRNYGLISFNNASLTNYGDTWGPIAVGGNLHLDGGSIAQKANLYGNSSDPSLYVAGNLTMRNYVHLENGYASLPGLTGSWTWDGTQKRLTGGGGTLSTSNTNNPLGAVDPRTNPTPQNFNFASIQAELAQASATLAATAANGLIAISGQTLTFSANGQTSGVVVFNLDMNDFNGVLYDANHNGQWNQNTERVSQVKIDVPTDVTYVINVLNATGKTIFNGINFNAGTNNDQLLWNITPDSNPNMADSVSLGGGARFYGSVLAPLIDLSNSGNVAPEGQIVVNSFSHNGAELHFMPFDSTVSFTPVPEPRTWALVGVMAAFAAIVLERRRRRRINGVSS
ncbi:collagen-binding domain-containing protein [Synoicihabitans lomoniglobus]|uniref:Choice-of-anchor A family protein n=1 Tax=Synoicihabitans lomoniglobus TaxID=2909285 RepID=A0AAF0CQM4_9BACT|nr:choice-of-anchor A family protein [Opitutaceae bacterium LMO-M01]WED66279.1 choice-of-anchor A family protein [Opitutaceae bacterium LMO-M01]